MSRALHCLEPKEFPDDSSTEGTTAEASATGYNEVTEAHADI